MTLYGTIYKKFIKNKIFIQHIIGETIVDFLHLYLSLKKGMIIYGENQKKNCQPKKKV